MQALDRLRRERPELEGEKLSYIGRLDPLAEGLMLVLVGEENKRREEYLHFDKEYEFGVLCGAQTDSGDVLGKVLRVEASGKCEHSEELVERFVGRHEWEYPVYSSRTVKGVPLFVYARAGRLEEIDIPTREMEILALKYLSSEEKSGTQLLKEIKDKIATVDGDFRQDEIVSIWEDKLQSFLETNFTILSFRARVSTGTYIRTLAEKIGDELKVPALAYYIKRTEIFEKR